MRSINRLLARIQDIEESTNSNEPLTYHGIFMEDPTTKKTILLTPIWVTRGKKYLKTVQQGTEEFRRIIRKNVVEHG